MLYKGKGSRLPVAPGPHLNESWETHAALSKTSMMVSFKVSPENLRALTAKLHGSNDAAGRKSNSYAQRVQGLGRVGQDLIFNSDADLGPRKKGSSVSLNGSVGGAPTGSNARPKKHKYSTENAKSGLGIGKEYVESLQVAREVKKASKSPEEMALEMVYSSGSLSRTAIFTNDKITKGEPERPKIVLKVKKRTE